MSFLFPEFELNRRAVLAGTTTALAGMAMGRSQAAEHAADGDWDLDDPAINLLTLLKFRADTSGADVISAFPGVAWAMVPNVGNFPLFKTFGIGASHIEEVPEGWRIYHREVLYYMDYNTGEILSEWQNPFLDRKVEVFHIANDPVNGVFRREGEGVLAAPYPYVAFGDEIIFQWSFFIYHKNEMPPKEYPLYSAGDYQQHAELWGIQGHKSDAMNPDITTAPSTTSWSRIGQFLPWMEMGNRPGNIVYHSHTYKLMGGAQELPRNILDHTEKNYAKYLESPKEWKDRTHNQSSYSVFKSVIDERRAATEL